MIKISRQKTKQKRSSKYSKKDCRDPKSMIEEEYNSYCGSYDTTLMCEGYNYRKPETPQEFEKYVECVELPKEYPNAIPLSQYPIEDKQGRKVRPDVTVVFNDGKLEAIDSKFKKRLTINDVEKLTRDIDAVGTETGAFFTNNDIKISNYVKDAAEEKKIRIKKTAVRKYD